MTDEQKVKEVYLDAEIDTYDVAGRYWYRVVRSSQLSEDAHDTASKAWADAASRLSKSESVPDDCLDITDDGKVIIAAPPAASPLAGPAPLSDNGHKFETKSHTDINGAGVHREYWQECVNCHGIFGEGDLITRCPKPAPQTFEEWWNSDKQWEVARGLEGEDDCDECCRAYALAAWSAAKASSQSEEDFRCPNCNNEPCLPSCKYASSPAVAGVESEALIRVIEVLKRASSFICKVDDLHQTIYSNGLNEDCDESIALLRPLIKDVRK